MKAYLMYSLDDGSVHNSPQAAIKHLDLKVEVLVRELAELMAHKNATDIMCDIAHRGDLLVLEIAKWMNYQRRVEQEIKLYYIEEKRS